MAHTRFLGQSLQQLELLQARLIQRRGRDQPLQGQELEICEGVGLDSFIGTALLV